MTETLVQPATTEVFTPQKVARLVFNSFHFSRGTGEVQFTILDYLATTHIDQFTDAACDDSKPILYEAAHKRVNTPHHRYGVSPSQVVEEIDDKYSHLDRVLDRARRAEKGEVEPDLSWMQLPDGMAAAIPESTEEERLLTALLRADVKWTDQYSNMSAVPGYQRSYRSNFIAHGLLSATTELAEFDEMFQTAADTFWAHTGGPNFDLNFYMDAIPEIAAAHLAFNPSDTEPLQRAVTQR